VPGGSMTVSACARAGAGAPAEPAGAAPLPSALSAVSPARKPPAAAAAAAKAAGGGAGGARGAAAANAEPGAGGGADAGPSGSGRGAAAAKAEPRAGGGGAVGASSGRAPPRPAAGQKDGARATPAPERRAVQRVWRNVLRSSPGGAHDWCCHLCNLPMEARTLDAAMHEARIAEQATRAAGSCG